MSRIYTLLLLSLLAITAFNSCSEPDPVQQEVLRPVTFQTVGNSNSEQVRTFSGAASAGDEIELSFRSGGVITLLEATAGQNVNKGDLIAKLDNVQANLALEQAKSSLNAAKSAMNTSKSNLDRIKSLYETGNNSLSDYESAKNSYQLALDQHESARKNKEIQQSQVNYGYIYAPKAGVIAAKIQGVNDNVSAGQAIAILNAGDEINVELGMPENVINRVKSGMRTDISFSSIDQEFEGSVIEVSPIVDPGSSTYPIKVDILNPSKEIKPGMAANVTFNFGGGEQNGEMSLVIPVKTVGEDSNGNFVYLIESDDGKTGIVKRQTIVVGELTSDGFKVISGLQEGQKIATAGLQTLLNGQAVRIQ